jgi:hypothetical protein
MWSGMRREAVYTLGTQIQHLHKDIVPHFFTRKRLEFLLSAIDVTLMSCFGRACVCIYRLGLKILQKFMYPVGPWAKPELEGNRWAR